MRIAVITTSFPVAAQPFITGHITGLLACGCQVDVYARNDTRHELHQDAYERFGLQDCVVYFGKCRQRFRMVRSALRGLARHPSVLPYLLKWRRCAKASAGQVVEALSLLGSLRRDDYDVVHVHYCVNAVFGGVMRKAGCAGHTIVCSHGSVFFATAGDKAVKAFLATFDRLLAVSSPLSRLALARGVPADRLAVFHVGIDLAAFPFRGVRDSCDVYRLLSVGRLVPVKGHALAIRAVAALRSRGCSVNYTILGGGPELDRLIQLVAELDVADEVQFCELVPHEQVVSWYQQADIYLHSGVTLPDGSFEGFGLAVAEAMAFGLPVVAFDCGGVTDLVRHDETGLLARPSDVEDFVCQIRRLMDSPPLADAIARRARLLVETEHDQQKQMEVLLRLYGG